jgi:methionine biosynthesis protein MetW
MKNFLYSIKRLLKDLSYYPEFKTEALSYDNYWQEKKKGHLGIPNSFQVSRGEWIASRIKDNSSIIDIGCGDGSVLFVIKKTKQVDVSGADVSQFILDFIQSKGVKAFFIDLEDQNAIEKIPRHDHMLLLETLEHMVSPEAFLHKALSNVNKSVFISVPNTGYIRHRMRLLFGRFPLQWRTHPSEHLRFWTKNDFVWWIRALKLEGRTTLHLYQGVPILNRIWPSLFAEGIIAEISK